MHSQTDEEVERWMGPYGGYCLHKDHQDESHLWEHKSFGVRCHWCDTIRTWDELERKWENEK